MWVLVSNKTYRFSVGDTVQKQPTIFHFSLFPPGWWTKKTLLPTCWNPSCSVNICVASVVFILYICSREALVSESCRFKRVMWRLLESEGQGCFAVLKDTFPVVEKGARWPVVSLRYCTDLTHQSEIQALTVANIKGLLPACPVPRGFFLLSILIHCRSQGGSSLIMKGRMDAPEPHPGMIQVNIHTGTYSHQRRCRSGPLEWLK